MSSRNDTRRDKKEAYRRSSTGRANIRRGRNLSVEITLLQLTSQDGMSFLEEKKESQYLQNQV